MLKIRRMPFNLRVGYFTTAALLVLAITILNFSLTFKHYALDSMREEIRSTYVIYSRGSLLPDLAQSTEQLLNRARYNMKDLIQTQQKIEEII